MPRRWLKLFAFPFVFLDVLTRLSTSRVGRSRLQAASGIDFWVRASALYSVLLWLLCRHVQSLRSVCAGSSMFCCTSGCGPCLVTSWPHGFGLAQLLQPIILVAGFEECLQLLQNLPQV